MRLLAILVFALLGGAGLVSCGSAADSVATSGVTQQTPVTAAPTPATSESAAPPSSSSTTSSLPETTVSTVNPPAATSVSPSSSTTLSSSPPPSSTTSPPSPPELPETLTPEVLAIYPHDTTAFTQGLLIQDGRVFESTGLFGHSSIRETSLASGQVLRNLEFVDADLPDPQRLFGEGLALVGDDQLVQLTWQAGLAFVWDLETFEQTQRPTQVFDYGADQQGWGLCYDGSRLVMSDGSDSLQFRSPAAFAVAGEPVAVRLQGQPIANINELECVDGQVWANIWLSDEIIRINPASGEVTAVVDAGALTQAAVSGCADGSGERAQLTPQAQAQLEALLPRLPADLPCPQQRPDAVLNGIAYDADRDVFLLTGKLWPLIFEVRFVPAG